VKFTASGLIRNEVKADEKETPKKRRARHVNPRPYFFIKQ